MSVNVDSVVSAMFTAGGAVVLREKSRIACNLGVPSQISDPWFTAHMLMALESHDLFTKILGSWVVKNRGEATVGSLTNIMKDMELSAVAEAISRLGSPETTISLSSTQQPPNSKSVPVTNSNPNSFTFGVKQPIQEFVGRPNVLKELNDLYIHQIQKCVLIYEIVGKGETELCKKFIHDLITANSSPPVVIWLSGKSMQKFTSKVSKLALQLSIPSNDDVGNPVPVLRLLKEVTEQIRNQFLNQRWIVVVDNVDEEYPELEKIIKILTRFQAFVLITSRRSDILTGAIIGTPLQLETLSSSDATLLVRNSLPNAADEDVISLCDKVGNHALALQLSVAYIKMQTQISAMSEAYSISHFLQELQQCQKSILPHPLVLADYNHTIHAIVRAALDYILTTYGKIGHVALELGIILGLVNPDGIHLDILLNLHQIYVENRPNPAQSPELTPKDTLEAVSLLTNFSIISVNDKVVSIHRLVQMVIRLEYDNAQTVGIFLKHIEQQFSSLDEVRQLISIWEHADYGTVKLYPYFALKIFDLMYALDLFAELGGFAKKNHALLSHLLGPNHKETLRMEYSIAHALSEMGDNEVALTMLQTLFEKEKGLFGEQHKSTISTALKTSVVLWNLDRYEEALKWGEDCLRSSVAFLGENHCDTTKTRNYIAVLLSALGRKDEALAIHRQVLQINEAELGPSHRITIVTRLAIFNILFYQKRYPEAKAEIDAVLKLSVQAFGEEHEDTVMNKDRLACTFWGLGMREDARRVLKEVLVSREKVLGPNHTTTNRTRTMLSAFNRSERGWPDGPQLEYEA